MKPIVMYGSIANASITLRSYQGATLRPFTSIQKLGVFNTKGYGADLRSWARMSLISLDIPLECLGRKVRVTVEVLDEIEETYVTAAKPPETSG